jgi:hypothetical protein
MLTPINLGALRISEECGDLYDVVKRSTGFITGTHDVDISSLPITSQARFRLAQWSLIVNAAVAEHEQQSLRSRAERIAPVVAPRVIAKPAEPAAPVVEPPKPEPQVDIAAHAREVVAREEAELKRLKDESRGIARLQQYSDEQGLEETPENLAAVQTFIDASPVKGYWSREIVDAAIQNLGPKGTNVLTWTPKTAPAPPQPPSEPAEPQEVLGTLPDGTTQLPLDVDQFTIRRASKEQARDWLKRRNAGKLLRPRGGFGSSF